MAKGIYQEQRSARTYILSQNSNRRFEAHQLEVLRIIYRLTRSVWKLRPTIRTLLGSGVHKQYCEIIADIYQESHFPATCGKELTREFLLTVGTKTGCPLSTLLFVIDLGKSLKEVHSLAIICSNIADDRRVSPIPVCGFADDIAFVSYLEKIINAMLKKLKMATSKSGLEIRPDKCAVMYERRSANKWCKVKGDKA